MHVSCDGGDDLSAVHGTSLYKEHHVLQTTILVLKYEVSSSQNLVLIIIGFSH